ncbi:MAG: NAD-dependent malic enzyme [Firmicutes bacterium HGW-Firmicutes-8]|nr:MAG: NAD-dependent malic enzyme [Firmicutes bacterium HGW-Firmicutes-8]
MTIRDEALLLHLKNKGKIEVRSKVKLENDYDLSLAYTPGVAEPCKEIAREPELVYKYTSKGNLVAVVSDGTAVLGLGDIGPEAALPVMEGKAVLFKEFAGVDAFPICVGTKDPDEIVKLVKLLEPTFGGINLEDIAAPRCFEIERRLKEVLEIPVFHDDQHGTAIVVMAGLINALKLAGKKLPEITVVINGSGSAGIAITKLLIDAGVGNTIMCDLQGIICAEAQWLNPVQLEMAKVTNKLGIKGSLRQALPGADVFIGVSGPGVLSADDIKLMADKPIVFAMANPIPEIMPDEAQKGGAFIVATGRSDYPNQINNVLAFPGIFRGALDVRARYITEGMKMAAAKAIAGLVEDENLTREYIIPKPFDKRVAKVVAAEVARAAFEEGVTRLG